METTILEPTEQISRTGIMENLYKTLCNAICNGQATGAKKWLAEKKLSVEATGVCYNSGEFHQGKSEAYKETLISIGFLSPSGLQKGNIKNYRSLLKYAMLFPLRNEKNHIVNFYAIGIKDGKTAFMSKEGIYPGYPKEGTKKLYLVNTILEAATLLESKILKKGEAVIALFDGTITPQHYKAIAQCKAIAEIILLDSNKNEDHAKR